MGQVWHKREKTKPLQPVAASHWRASKYCLEPDPSRVEAAPNAIWEQFEAFETYRPFSKAREKEHAGPHLSFLNVHTRMQKDLVEGVTHVKRFAEHYGLLGLFFRRYLEHPVLPDGKSFIAAEAVIDERGKLWRIDPATEGRALLTGLNDIGGVKALSATTRGKVLIEAAARFPRVPIAQSIAMPSEVAFPVREDEASDPFGDRNRKLVSWEEAKKDFGALLVLDERSPRRVSVLSTSEPLRLWRAQLAFFPSPDVWDKDEYKQQLLEDLINPELEGVSPFGFVGEDGRLERNWRYRDLLQAMYLMLYLDLTGGSDLRKCASQGCPDPYYRRGPQSKSIYCSERCANRASTRMGRGQEP